MNDVVIGIDPDSKAHGVATYINGKLCALESLALMELLDKITEVSRIKNTTLEVHLEDVNAVSAAFNARDKKTNINVKLKMAQHIGMCKQAQVEIERMMQPLSVKVVKHKISKAWKKDKAQFEKITGWSGRSNEDTRSAAYFGWLGCK